MEKRLTTKGFMISRYFIIRKPISRALELYVSGGLTVGSLNLKLKTVKNGISKFSTGQSTYWRHYKDRDAIMIDYDSIPANSKIKAKLPLDSKSMYERLIAELSIQEDVQKDAEFRSLLNELRDAYNKEWPRSLKYYKDKIEDVNQCRVYAKSHSLVEKIIQISNLKWPSKIIFKCYTTVIKEQLDNLDKPKFQTISEPYFWRKIKECKEIGIYQSLIHDSLGKPKPHFTKMTGQIKAFIRIQLRDPRRFLISKIIEKVKEKYKVILSPASIKSFKAERKDRNILEFDSNGKEFGRQNSLPKITREIAEGSGEQYQGDYYDLQFICVNSLGKVIRLISYVVLDVFSKKIVGWSLGEKKTASMAVQAFKMAFVDHALLPEEIIVDNDPFYKRPVWKRFIKRVNDLGVITTDAEPDLPTWKAEIEGNFAVFQKFHSDKPGYIGESVKSKNVAGNPAREYVQSLYKNTSSLSTIREQVDDFCVWIKQFNERDIKRKKLNPTESFRINKSDKAKLFEPWMESLLFWKTITKKRIRDDGRIDFYIEGVRYRYQITEAETLWSYKNGDVRMCYNEEDFSIIHIFDRDNLKFIGAVEPRMVMNRKNKNEVLRRQKAILAEANKYINDKRLADEVEIKEEANRPANKLTLDSLIIQSEMKSLHI